MGPGRRFERIDEASIQIPPADVSYICRKWLDLPYASTSQAQKLDIYLPAEGNGPFPVILHLHGGAFAIGDKRDIHLLPLLKGLQRGYAVVSVNYRLSGEAIFPAGLQDIKAAIRWLRANQQEYHLDGNRIAAWGGSAGGYYVAMVCLTANVAELDDLSLGNPQYPCHVQAAVDWFGPIDFLAMDKQLAGSGLGLPDHSEADSPESRYMGAKITEIQDQVRRASPMTYVHADMPPILIQHGRLDPMVPVQQSMVFVQKLKELAGHERFEFDILENAGHGDPLFETDENMNRVFQFIDRYLKRPGGKVEPVAIGQGLRPAKHYAIQDEPPPADTGHIKRRFLDIPYATLSPAQKLDIYLPDEGDGPFPVIVSIHGGAFMGCDKADLQVLPMLEGLKRGYAVVAINYRLSGEARFPALVHDAKAAVRWIRANARRYHFDPGRIAAWGGSAGAYLAAMLGTSAGVRELEDLSMGNADRPSTVQAVVTWYGPTDFSKMDEQLTRLGLPPAPGMEHNGVYSPESLLLGEQITRIPDRVKAANPETYITPAAPPFLLQHGTMDAVVPVQQSINFAARLEQALGRDRVELVLLEGAEHADPRFETPENVERVLGFLDRYLE